MIWTAVASWFTKGMTKWLLLIGAVLVVTGALYGKGRMDAARKAEVAEMQKLLDLAFEALQKERTARKADAAAAEGDALHIEALENQIEGLNADVAKMEDATRVCLDAPDTERMRDLWK